MSNSHNYSTAHSIFKLFEFLGWITVALGALLALIGLASGNFPIFPQIGDPTFSDRLIAMIPGLLFVEVGFIQIVLVKVGQANVDTAEMTQEILKIAKSGQQVAPRSRPPVHETAPQSQAQASKPDPRTKMLRPGEQVLVETYKGVEIHRRYEGHYIDERWFARLKQAKEHIDSVSSEPILELTPDTSATKEAEDTLVEIYKGVEIHQPEKPYHGHTVGDQSFLGLEAAKKHIDGLTSDQGQD